MHWSKNPKKREEVLSKIKKSKKGKPSPRKGVILSEETKKKISKSKKGQIPWIKGKKHTKEAKEKMGLYFKERYKKENHPNYGKKLSEETCNKKSKSLKKAYKEGRMDYMKEVWKDGKKRFSGKNNPKWKPIGSKRVSHDYVLIKIEEGKWVKEERYIAEKKLGRKLKGIETIHHIDGNKSNNKIENLYLMLRKEHKAWHTLDNINKNLVDIRPKLISNLI